MLCVIGHDETADTNSNRRGGMESFRKHITQNRNTEKQNNLQNVDSLVFVLFLPFHPFEENGGGETCRNAQADGIEEKGAKVLNSLHHQMSVHHIDLKFYNGSEQQDGDNLGKYRLSLQHGQNA